VGGTYGSKNLEAIVLEMSDGHTLCFHIKSADLMMSAFGHAGKGAASNDP